MAKQVLVEIKVEGSQSIQQLNQIEKELVDVKKQRQELNKQVKKGNEISEKEAAQLAKLNAKSKELTRQKGQLQKAVINENKAHNKLISAYDRESAELNELRKKLKNVLLTEDKMSKSTLKLAKRVQHLDTRLKRVDKAAGQFQRNVGNYQSGFKGMAAGIGSAALAATGGVMAIQSLISIGRESIDALNKQEKAEKSLEVALGRRSQALLDQASALQKQTKFGDEATIQAQSFLAQMGLQEEQILKLTPAIQDFAEAQGVSLEDAAKLVAKSVGSSTNALSRYGISIEGAAGSNERAESAVAALSQAFDGQAQAAAKVGTGALTQFQNRIGDLQEKLGKLITGGMNPFIAGGSILDKVLDDASKGMDVLLGNTESLGEGFTYLGSLAQSVRNQFEFIKATFRVLMSVFREVGGLIEHIVGKFIDLEEGGSALNESMIFFQKILMRIPNVIGVVADFVINNIKNIALAIEGVIDIVFGLGKVFKSVAGLAIDNFISLGKIIQAVFSFDKDAIAKSITEAMDTAKKGITDALTNTDEIVEGGKKIGEAVVKGVKNANPIENVKKIIEALSTDPEVADAAESSGESIGNSLAKGIASGLSTGLIKQQSKIVSDIQKAIQEATTETDIIGLGNELARAEKELKRLQDLAKRTEIKLIAPRDTPNILDGIEDKIEPVEVEVRSTFKEDQKAELQKQVKEAAFGFAQEVSDAAFQVAIDNAERRKQFEIDQLQTRTDAESDAQKARLDQGLISQREYEASRKALEQETLQERENIEREAFKRNQNLQVLQAIANGALAITQSLANTTLPFPASLVGPATIAASTGIQIATIKSQKFADGGLLKGASHAQGGIPMTINGQGGYEAEGGEAIINKRSTAMFAPLLSSINQIGGGVAFESGGVLPKFANGGIAGGSTSNDMSGIGAEIAKGLGDIRVVNVATETAEVNNTVVNIENDVSI